MFVLFLVRCWFLFGFILWLVPLSDVKGPSNDPSNFQRQAKNQLRAMAFNLMNVEEQRFFTDKKMIDAITTLNKKVVLL